MEKTTKKVLFIILDGYGEGKDYPGNAIKKAKSPFMDAIRKKYPQLKLKCSGNAVGLPKGTMGGSEVGHFTIGAGRVVYQSLERIDRDFRSKKIRKNKGVKKAMENCLKKKSSLHLLGMISDAGVHSHLNHLFGLLREAKRNKIKDVYIHCITDGRDVPEKSADKYLKKISDFIKQKKIGKISTIIGRYYAMDRDQNWNRTKKAYDLLTKGSGLKEKNPFKAVLTAYKLGDQTDYYLRPIVIDENGVIKNNDSVIFFNFRTDRAKQLTQVFTQESECGLKENPPKLTFVCFGSYSKKAIIAFPDPVVKNNLGEYLSKHHLKQLKVAETEKYAHVTFFFNSQNKNINDGEKRILIPSLKVSSYSEKPEMSAEKITETVIENLKKSYEFILVNYANPDLVGHSGDLKATIRCIEYLDRCLEKVIPSALKNSYDIIISADHGNAEQMLYDDLKSPCPSHSMNKVIFILISEKNPQFILKKEGALRDIAPTIIDLFGLNKPKEMTGHSLILHSKK